ncbi:MAG TPA: GNAT family N-acetyltransferase [Planctomycetota bacterium]|nr:GNAT family N-acetyltransferase [Planctomycetota bacterium]
MQVEIVEANLMCSAHQAAIRSMTAAYALDPMGNGGPLPADVLDRLIPGLQRHPTTCVFLAFDGTKPVGIATCFIGFSTFAAKPLVNIHDLAVLPACRGHGLGKRLLEAVTRKARELGCCKVTLEVQENNRPARRVYQSCGFTQAVYGPETGGSLFYVKALEHQ